MKAGDPVGKAVGPRTDPWGVGTWVWHAQTREGPWVVLRDDGDLVYVDTKPARPAIKPDLRQAGYHHRRITLDHKDVGHFYATMLVDQEPEPPEPKEWEKALGGFWWAGVRGAVILFFCVAALLAVTFSLEWFGERFLK